jgi:ABC-type Mn2+/Zn2+ transport system ATPase subunit
MSSEILRFEDVTVRYGNVMALEDFSVAIPCTSMTAICGPNGAGKSTLLRVAMGWLSPGGGKVYLGDDHIEHHHPRLAYLPQQTRVDLDFPITVREVVEQGRFPALGHWAPFRAEDHAMVNRALEELGISDLARRPIGALSGGQRQRVFLARALAQGADIFLLDEPFDGLDAKAMHQLLETLTAWATHHRTVVAVVHDLDLVRRAFPRCILMNRHLVSEGTTASVLSEEAVAVAYGWRPAATGGSHG